MKTWPDELRDRCIAAGYEDVLIGRNDVEGVRANGDSLCLESHVHGNKLYAGGVPIIWTIVKDLEIPIISRACHWIGLDHQRMTPEQKDAIADRPIWVCERKKHRGLL